MKVKWLLIISICWLAGLNGNAQTVTTSYVNAFENLNHPQVAYWFFTENMAKEETYQAKIDSFVKFSKYKVWY